MTHTEALSIVGVVAAAYEQSWRPSKAAVEVYCEILAVPELDFDSTRAAVLVMLRSDRRFAPTAGEIFQAARAGTREKFRREVLPRIVREIVEAAENRDDRGVVSIECATRAIERHPLVRLHKFDGSAWEYLRPYMERDRARFGLAAPTAVPRLLQ